MPDIYLFLSQVDVKSENVQIHFSPSLKKTMQASLIWIDFFNEKKTKKNMNNNFTLGQS